MELVSCKRCGHVRKSVSKEYALEITSAYAAFIKDMDKDLQRKCESVEEYIEHLTTCLMCGNSSSGFSDETDLQEGVFTVSPILLGDNLDELKGLF